MLFRSVSDHDRNLLVDLEGDLARDVPALLARADRLLELEPDLRDGFVAARRAGFVRTLDTYLADDEMRRTFPRLAADLRRRGAGSLVAGLEAELGPRRL